MPASAAATSSRPEAPVRPPPTPRRFGRVNWLGLRTLYRREMRRHLGGWRETIAGVAVSSLLFLAVFHLALASAPQPLPGISLTSFLVPGLVLVAIGEKAFEAASYSILIDKLEGIISDVLMPPLTPAERSLAYTLAAASSGLASGAAAAAVLLPFVPMPEIDPLPLLFFLAAGALLYGLCGILAGLWAERWDHLAAAQTFGLVPLVYLSGSFFATADLPPAARLAVRVNPSFYAVDGLRFAWLGRGEGDPALSALLLVALIAVLMAIVWHLFRTGYKLQS